MPVVREKDSPTFDLDGFRFHGLTAPSRGATELCSWRLDVAPGAESETHQINHEEVFIVLEGSINIVTAAETIELHAGDALNVPAHTLFHLKNGYQKTAHLVVCLPVGFHATMANGSEIGTPPWAR